VRHVIEYFNPSVKSQLDGWPVRLRSRYLMLAEWQLVKEISDVAEEPVDALAA
jgi:hypothetical protein